MNKNGIDVDNVAINAAKISAMLLPLLIIYKIKNFN